MGRNGIQSPHRYWLTSSIQLDWFEPFVTEHGQKHCSKPNPQSTKTKIPAFGTAFEKEQKTIFEFTFELEINDFRTIRLVYLFNFNNSFDLNIRAEEEEEKFAFSHENISFYTPDPDTKTIEKADEWVSEREREKTKKLIINIKNCSLDWLTNILANYHLNNITININIISCDFKQQPTTTTIALPPRLYQISYANVLSANTKIRTKNQK